MKYKVRRDKVQRTRCKEMRPSELQNSNFRLRKGFTLVEILVYIVILSIIILVISSIVLWLIQANTKAKVMREALDNARRGIEIMNYEIKEASSIYLPTSAISSHPGQLSLETVHYLPTGEQTSYIDFYLCGSQLCFKKESQDAITLTSDRVEVSNLVFTRIISGQAPSVQIDLTIDYLNPGNKPEYQASVNLTSTISLRVY